VVCGGVVRATLFTLPLFFSNLYFVLLQPMINSKPQTMEDYGIRDGSQLLCMRLLYTIDRTMGLDRVVFNLKWGFSKKGYHAFSHSSFSLPYNPMSNQHSLHSDLIHQYH
jgi:hypothetical protein